MEHAHFKLSVSYVMIVPKLRNDIDLCSINKSLTDEPLFVVNIENEQFYCSR